MKLFHKITILTLLFLISPHKSNAKGNINDNFFCVSCDHEFKCNCYHNSNVKFTPCESDDNEYGECIMLCSKSLKKLQCKSCHENKFGYLNCQCQNFKDADFFTFSMIDELFPKTESKQVHQTESKSSNHSIVILYPDFIGGLPKKPSKNEIVQSYKTKPKPQPQKPKVQYIAEQPPAPKIQQPANAQPKAPVQNKRDSSNSKENTNKYSFKTKYEDRFLDECEKNGNCDPLIYQTIVNQ